MQSLVLGVNHHRPLMPPGDRKDVEDLPVVELQVVIGQVDLERGIAVLDQRRQLLAADRWRRVGDDEMEGVVDQRLAVGPPVIVPDRLFQAMATHLQRERDDRRGPPGRRRTGAGGDIVGADGAVGGRLIQVAVAVDPARRNRAAGGVDDPCGILQIFRQRGIRLSRMPMSQTATSAAVATRPPHRIRSTAVMA